MIEKWGHEAGEGKRGERSPKKRGGGGGGWRGRNNQMSVSGVWPNTCVQYGGRVLARFPDLYTAEVGETAG